ncbi:MAG: hypothetical protein WBP45_10680 [Daejeonella sp.]
MNRIPAILLACVTLITSFLCYMENWSRGYPDGRKTEFDLAIKHVFSAFSIISLVTAFIFIILAIRAKHNNTGKLLKITTLVYVLMVIAFFIINYYFGLKFNDGLGG